MDTLHCERNVTPREGAEHINRDIYVHFRDQVRESYVGEALGVGKIIGAQYEYDDLQEGFIEYHGKAITMAEAYHILDEEIMSEARRYINRFCAQ